VRLQTWFPFTVHIVINGREWLSRELCRKGIDFERRENCFTDLADVSRAQKAMDRQLRTAWPRLLDRLVRQVHPAHRTLFGKDRRHRRAEISQKSNERYLEALSAVDAEPTLAETAAGVCRRTRWKKRSVRALNPLADEDAKLLEAVSRGEFVLLGFRNRDLRGLLFGKPASADVRRRQTAKVTRLIRMLRAHGLVHKVPKTHRYTVSPKGRETIAALLAARSANTQKLMKLAA